VVATRLHNGTEVVLAERTRPFNESDPSYFHRVGIQLPRARWESLQKANDLAREAVSCNAGLDGPPLTD
jgi:hypothetical protein